MVAIQLNERCADGGSVCREWTAALQARVEAAYQELVAWHEAPK